MKRTIIAAFALVANLFAVEFDYDRWDFETVLTSRMTFRETRSTLWFKEFGSGDAMFTQSNLCTTWKWVDGKATSVDIWYMNGVGEYVHDVTLKCSFTVADLQKVATALFNDGDFKEKFGVATPTPTIAEVDTPTTSEAVTSGVEADFHMTADEFMISRTDGEANNELKWDLSHEGKIFHITGTVDRVMRQSARYNFSEYNKDEPWAKDIIKRIQDTELSDIISVGLDAPEARDHFDSINFTKRMRDPEVHFGPEYERVLSTLKKGDTIEVVGRYLTKTWNMGASAFGPTCKIVSITRDGKRMPVDPTPLRNVAEVEPKYDDLTNVPAEESLTASELYNTFYRDETGNDLYLEREWSGKVVEVTGKVVAVEKGRKSWISDYANAGTAWGAWIKEGDQPDGYIAVTLQVDTIDKRFKTKAEGVVVTLNFDKKHIRDLIVLETGDKITAKGRVLLGNGPLANQLLNCRVYGLNLQIGPTCSIVIK